jgi:hypothetical protein
MTPSRSSRTFLGADTFRRAAAVFAAALLATAAAAASRPREPFLIEHPFPVEARTSFPGGLFHWMDSLAGTTVGKTIPAHREEFLRLFGPLTGDDTRHLNAFVAARAEHMKMRRELPPSPLPRATGSALLGIFCRGGSVDAALASAKPELTPESWAGLDAAVRHFEPKYRTVWNGGAVPQAFIDSARADRLRPRLEALLAKIARFYRVDPTQAPPPRIALVPVPEGYGTHAEAIDGVLLIEIRPRETLSDEASVIVHELSHFLWSIVPAERQQRMAGYVLGLDEASARTYRLLGEGIPTALGQGVADRIFRPRQWSPEAAWYHLIDVDACAHRVYPLVSYALEADQPFDERFLLRFFQQSAPGGGSAGSRRRFLVSP